VAPVYKARMIEAVPFIDISRFEDGFVESFIKKTELLVNNTHFVGGPDCEHFETNIAKYCAVPYAMGCANGTDALQLALRALNIGPGSKVLVPDSNFWAAFEAVVNVGAEPILVDVSKETLHLDRDLLKTALEKERPNAAILVHLYGWAAPFTAEIRNLCEQYDCKLLEDSAQAIGTKINGESLIGSARYSTTSFYPAKVLGASGDAGAVFTHDKDFSQSVTSLRNHGRAEHYLYSHVGWNSRLGAYEAAYLNLALKHLDSRIKSRMRAVNIYRENFSNTELQPLSPDSNTEENGYLSVFLCKTPSHRNQLIHTLNESKIGYGIVYPTALSDQPAAKEHIKKTYLNNTAKEISAKIINLPVFSRIRDEEISRVCDVVTKHLNSGS